MWEVRSEGKSDAVVDTTGTDDDHDDLTLAHVLET